MSGTEILQFIETSLHTLQGNSSTAAQAIADFYQLKWILPKIDLLSFKTEFNRILSLIMETSPEFSFEQVKHAWIRALPSEDAYLQMKLNKSNLDIKWSSVETAAELFVLALEEMRNCSITYTTESNKLSTKPKPLTAKLCKNAPNSSRSDFPDDFP